MKNFFDLDSPVMRFLSRMADIIILNILVLVTIIPIITIGASLSAMHYVLIKMVRNEENYIVKMYFKAFKDNFKKGTLLWLIMVVIIGVFFADYRIFMSGSVQFPGVLLIAVMAVAVVAMLTSMYVFPLQARFENSVGGTLKNAFLLMILNFPKTILMAIVYCIPVLLILVSNLATPLLIMFGFSGPGLAAAYLYRKVFAKFEPEAEENGDPDAYSITGEDMGTKPEAECVNVNEREDLNPGDGQ